MKPLCKRWLLGVFLLAGCGSTGDSEFQGSGSTNGSASQVLARGQSGTFAVIEGHLSDSQASAWHRLKLEPGLFSLPGGQVTLIVRLEQESGNSLRLRLTPSLKNQVIALADGLQFRAQLDDLVELEVFGQGAYRLLVSLAGDSDGDGDVDLADGQGFEQNLGVSTRVRPLELHFALDPGPEPLAGLQESLDATAHFSGRVSPNSSVVIQPSSSVQAKTESIPVHLNPDNSFSFRAPLAPGENQFNTVATDSFGQQAEASALVSQVAESSEPPASISEDRKNRIWLLDVHANNYLFRGPLPLTSLDESGRVDFPSLIRVMNARLVQEGAPIPSLPAEFDFVEISLIGNRATSSASHGDEGNSLYLIYQSILGGTPQRPVADEQKPTSLFTRPLDNAPASGNPFDQVVDGQTYRIHPSVIWQPISANSTGLKPTTLADGSDSYATVLRSTFPIVALAPDLTQPLRALTNPLSNLSVATRTLHQLMEQDHIQERVHVYYFHCVNGHDRTGMVSTSYVLSAYGPAFNYDLATAYKYGQNTAFLPGAVPPGVDARRNFWDKLEEDNKNTGKLKKKYMQAVQALAYLYYHPEDGKIQKEPALAPNVPDVPLWNAGFPFASAANAPTLATPADYVHVRDTP